MSEPTKPSVFGSPLSGREGLSVLAFIAQVLLCLGGGAWAGYASDPDAAATLLMGALGLVFAWFAALWSAHAVAMLLASAFLVRSGVRWLRGKQALESSEQRRRRSTREDRVFYVALTATMIGVFFLLAAIVGVVVWALAADASFLATLARMLGVALLVNLLTPLAIHQLDSL